jgi:hypothetical protein
MSFEPSSPSTDIPNKDPFDGVAYSDVVEGSIEQTHHCSYPTFRPNSSVLGLLVAQKSRYYKKVSLEKGKSLMRIRKTTASAKDMEKRE